MADFKMHLQFLSSADRIQHGAYAPWMSMTPEEKNHKFQQWRAELRRAAEVWIQNLEDGPFKMQGQRMICERRAVIGSSRPP